MKICLSGFIFLVQFNLLFAQQGLENLIVEKYYFSNDIDENATKGALTSGSVTYRIFVDMLPGYRFQAVYGVPGHQVKISTTSYFFNDEEFGGTTANEISNYNLKKGTVMLDSWLSVCGGSQGNIAILKSDDYASILDSSSVVLKNSGSEMGKSLLIADGLFPAFPLAIVSSFGIDSLQMSIFRKNNPESEGQVFTTDNGSWASFGGTIGLDTTNRVIIAQMTTNGELSFELNIQLGSPSGAIENYVAKNPANGEIFFPGLNFKSTDENSLIKGKL